MSNIKNFVIDFFKNYNANTTIVKANRTLSRSDSFHARNHKYVKHTIKVQVKIAQPLLRTYHKKLTMDRMRDLSPAAWRMREKILGSVAEE